MVSCRFLRFPLWFRILLTTEDAAAISEGPVDSILAVFRFGVSMRDSKDLKAVLAS